MRVQFHPVAGLFDLLEGDDFEGLAESIATHGQRDAILYHDEGNIRWILDGRNRYRACVSRGIEPKWEAWNGQGSLIELSLDRNLSRRHLTPGQRAMAVARGEEMAEMESRAQKRQHAGLKRGDEAPSVSADTNGDAGRTRAKLAKIAKVSEASAARAAKVRKKGTAELQAAAAKGEIGVERAAKLADKSAEEQLAELKKDKERAEKVVQKIDSKEALDRWAATLEKIRRQASQHDPEVPALVVVLAAAVAAVAECQRVLAVERRRLVGD